MEDLIGIGTLFLVFGIVLILAGIYIFTGHKSQILFGRAWVSVKNATKEDLRRIGKIILIIATIMCIISGTLLLIANHQEKSSSYHEPERKIPLTEIQNIINDYFANVSEDASNYISSYIDNNNNVIVVKLKDNSKEKQEEFIHDVFSSSAGSTYIKYLKDNSVLKFVQEDVQEEIVTKVAYANWRSEYGTFGADEGCLNGDKFIFSDYPRLAVYKLDTKSQLDSFKEKYKNDFTMDQGYSEIPSFNDVTQNYDDEFFNNCSLILTYKEASSGSLRFEISQVVKENGTLTLKVFQINNPETYTDDMSGWFLIAEVSKDYLKDCNSFDAYFVGVVGNEEEKVIIPTSMDLQGYEF